MSYNSTQYDEMYYKSHCGECYERGHGWEEIFARQASQIVKELKPHRVLDVGCAEGYLVEGLRDLGVEAYGIDISDYAISKVREDIKSYCSVKSATDRIEEKYDLITCIEVVEHLSPKDFKVAIENMCSATDTIIFSSTPFDYNEESHISINPVSFWVEQFAYNGFYHDISYDCSYIAIQTMLFRRAKKTNIDLIREYEDRMFQLWTENCTLRYKVNLSNMRIADLDKGNLLHAQEIEEYKQKIEELNRKYEALEEEFTDPNKRCRDILKKEIERNDALGTKLISLRAEKDELKKQVYFLQCELEKSTVYEKKFHYLWKIYFNLKSSCINNKLLKLRCKMKKTSIEEFGWLKERTYYDLIFDEECYYERNSDIAEMLGNDKTKLFEHFLIWGMKEGRTSSYNFDVIQYRKYNPDIEKEFGDNWEKYFLHYLQYGYFENRRCY